MFLGPPLGVGRLHLQDEAVEARDHDGLTRGQPVALSVLLDRVPGVRLLSPDHTRVVSAVLRGPRGMQVAFDEVLPASAVRSVSPMT